MKKRLLTIFGIALLLFSLRAFLIERAWNENTAQKTSFIELLSSRDSRVCQFDCVHYAQISEKSSAPDPSSAAFFPLWTSLIRATNGLAPHVHEEVLAVWLSNIFLLASVGAALLLAQNLGFSTPLCATFFLPLGLLIFPFGVSSSFGYGEPIFLLLYLLALHSVWKKNYFSAALWLGLLSATRIQGVIVAGAFIFTLLLDSCRSQPDSQPPARVRLKNAALFAFLSLAPFLAYVFWQWKTWGDHLAFVHAQSHWGREFSPLRGLLDQLPRPKMFPVMIWICLAGSFYALKKRDFFWNFLALATLGLTEVPLFSGGLMSYARYLSVNVGLFIFVAELFHRKPSWRWVELVLLIWAVQGFDQETVHLLINRICP